MEQGRGTAGLNDGMVENAVALRLRQCGVGHLIHADSARSRLVDRERIRGQTLPPIGPCNGIACAFHLGERGQQPQARWRWWSIPERTAHIVSRFQSGLY